MRTKNTLVAALLLSLHFAVLAQTDSLRVRREYVAYTLFYNVVPDNFNVPLIGFLNLAKGSHKGIQLGFVNTTLKNFAGAQTGFVNTTIGNFSGGYIGFVNTTIGDAKGGQVGFVNTVFKDHSGAQIGYINTNLGSTSGIQVGFVNTALRSMQGFQFGFVNTAIQGIKGSQFGFVNIADTVSGVPIGFLSIVRKGGYRVVEVSLSELYPVNVAFKIGVPRLYTFVQGSFNPSYAKPFAVGLGMGSLVPVGAGFWFNPEVGSLSSIANNSTSVLALAANLRYGISPRLQVAAGPSVVWLNYPVGENLYAPPFFAVVNHEINSQNRILVGARAALSFSFTKHT